MRIFATDEVQATSKFWYFMKKLKKLKKTRGEIVFIGQVCFPAFVVLLGPVCDVRHSIFNMFISTVIHYSVQTHLSAILCIDVINMTARMCRICVHCCS